MADPSFFTPSHSPPPTSTHRFARLLCLVVLAVGLFGCDHATKIAAKTTLENAAAVPVAPGMLHGAVELRYVENRDMAFNALGNLGLPHSPAILIGLSAVAIAAIAAMALLARRRRKQEQVLEGGAAATNDSGRMDRATQAGLALIVGGALGNVVDRIARGYVVDFIHVKGWPVFNVADIAVVAGMILMALPRLKKKRKPQEPVQEQIEP